MSMPIEQAMEAVEGQQAAHLLEGGPGGEAPWRRLARRFRHNLPAMAGLGIVLLFVFVAIFASVLAPQSPSQTSAALQQGPSAAHWLGTDSVGRDLTSRLIQGTRASMQVAFQVVILSTLLALPLGLVAGYFRKWSDAVIMRCMDALFTFPAITLALAVAAILGPSLNVASIAIAITFTPGIVRLVRAQTLAVREETFIEASKSVGAGPLRMLRKHVFPNVVSPMIVQLALAFGYAIGAEAGLSFLGFGVQVPTASWGTMLESGFASINETVWPLVPPGVAIVVAILGFNLVGDGMRDALGRESFIVAVPS
jgi:peptide/nickel transport system permease protein